MEKRKERILSGRHVQGTSPLIPSAQPLKSNANWTGINLKKSLLSKELTEKDLDQILQKAYAAGRKAGRKEGFEIGSQEGYEKGYFSGCQHTEKKLASSFQLLEVLHKELRKKQEEVLQTLKPELISFCFVICEKILMKELSKEHSIRDLIKKLIDESKEFLSEQSATLFLSPKNFQMLQPYTKEFSDTLILQKDSRLPDGSIRIETSLGLIHFDSKRLLRQLKTHVLGITKDSKEVHV